LCVFVRRFILRSSPKEALRPALARSNLRPEEVMV
jgi:hypothetical protein